MIDSRALNKVATVIMGQSPSGDTYNEAGVGLPLLNGPTEFGSFSPHCTLFTTASCRECQSGDLIFCVRGSTTGRMNWADQRYSLGRGVCAIRGSTKQDTRYLRGCIEDRLQALLNLAGGGTFPNLTKNDIEGFEVPWPLEEVRHRIASILSAYDDLIENNRKRIAILEDMARRFFREWFVHFRYPGHEAVPLVDSPLGRIPRGWEVKRVDAVCHAVLDGDWIETKDQGGSDFRLLQISNIGLGDFVETGNFRYVTQATFDRLRCTEIKPDDLLVARMPTPIGRAWLARKMPWPMITAVDVAIIRPNTERIDPVFLLHFWNQPSTLALIEKQSSGTTRLRITRRELCALLVPTPVREIQGDFAGRVRPMLDLANNMRDQIEVLRRTRDLLLPRLMSGQLSVEVAEAAVP